jgi:hypothetical protein
MSENLTLIIIGIYTLVYVIVFFIQKTSLDRLKEGINSQNLIINSMKTFMDIFDVDKIKKYVELNEESVMLKASNFVANDEKVKALALEFTKAHADEIKNLQMEKLDEQYLEMSKFIVKILSTVNEEEGKKVIELELKSCQHIFNRVYKSE